MQVRTLQDDLDMLVYYATAVGGEAFAPFGSLPTHIKITPEQLKQLLEIYNANH